MLGHILCPPLDVVPTRCEQLVGLLLGTTVLLAAVLALVLYTLSRR